MHLFDAELIGTTFVPTVQNESVERSGPAARHIAQQGAEDDLKVQRPAPGQNPQLRVSRAACPPRLRPMEPPLPLDRGPPPPTSGGEEKNRPKPQSEQQTSLSQRAQSLQKIDRKGRAARFTPAVRRTVPRAPLAEHDRESLRS